MKFTYHENFRVYSNLSLLSRHLNHYRCLLNYVLQALVNKSVNMVKQLYYSEIHSKNIDYLSKLYTGKYSEVNDVIKYMPKHAKTCQKH